MRVTGKYICSVGSDEEESENEKWGRQREGGIEGGVIKPVRDRDIYHPGNTRKHRLMKWMLGEV